MFSQKFKQLFTPCSGEVNTSSGDNRKNQGGISWKVDSARLTLQGHTEHCNLQTGCFQFSVIYDISAETSTIQVMNETSLRGETCQPSFPALLQYFKTILKCNSNPSL